MLRARLSNARFAIVVAAAVALLGSGIVMGAVGDPLIIGAVNDGGTGNTRLDAYSSASGGAFWMRQHGSGAGIRGDSTTGAGGVFTTASGNSYGLYTVNNGSAGTGSAIRADGNANPALDLRVNSNSVAPMVVNSTHVVTNLNADLLDGQHATGFHQYNTSAPALSTQYGAFSVEGSAAAAGAYDSGTISYPVPINAVLTTHVIPVGGPVPSGCSGSVTAPAASAGNLCIFEGFNSNIAGVTVFTPEGGSTDNTAHYGAFIQTTSTTSGSYVLSGTWAATAPLVIIILPQPTGPQPQPGQ